MTARIETRLVAPLIQEFRKAVPVRIIGYVRVSKTSQTTEHWVDARKVLVAAAVYADERVSGAKRDHDGLNAALAEVQPGDALAAVSMEPAPHTRQQTWRAHGA